MKKLFFALVGLCALYSCQKDGNLAVEEPTNAATTATVALAEDPLEYFEWFPKHNPLRTNVLYYFYSHYTDDYYLNPVFSWRFSGTAYEYDEEYDGDAVRTTSFSIPGSFEATLRVQNPHNPALIGNLWRQSFSVVHFKAIDIECASGDAWVGQNAFIASVQDDDFGPWQFRWAILSPDKKVIPCTTAPNDSSYMYADFPIEGEYTISCRAVSPGGPRSEFPYVIYTQRATCYVGE